MPFCLARVSAGRKSRSLFYEEVIVEGAKDNLSFNIMIRLPVSEQVQHQGNSNNNIIIIIMILILAPSSESGTANEGGGTQMNTSVEQLQQQGG